MSRAFANRVAKLETRVSSIVIPNVISVRYDETAADALARFRAEHGAKITAHHGVIIVPARIDTPETEADFAARFYVHQTQLVANAKSARPREMAQ
jgi:hypothetical protein